MKIVLYIFVFHCIVSNVYSQKSLFLFQIDTNYITYDLTKSHVVRNFTRSNDTDDLLRLNELFFLLDSSLVLDREKLFKLHKEEAEVGGGTITSAYSNYSRFSLYFVHKPIIPPAFNGNPNNSNPLEEQFYQLYTIFWTDSQYIQYVINTCN